MVKWVHVCRSGPRVGICVGGGRWADVGSDQAREARYSATTTTQPPPCPPHSPGAAVGVRVKDDVHGAWVDGVGWIGWRHGRIAAVV